jgi:hypothetical protein
MNFNDEYFLNLRLKCPHCLGESKYENNGFNMRFIYCKNNCYFEKNRTHYFIKAYIEDGEIYFLSFFIYKENDSGFIYCSSSSAPENLLALNEDEIINLIENFSKDCDIKKIQKKHETLVLFE